MKVATWNVNGIRARGKEVAAWSAAERPDLLCLQEIKAAPDQITDKTCPMDGYRTHWHGARGGYSGVSIHAVENLGEPTPLYVPFDFETRVLALSFKDVDVLSVYAPNGGKDYEAKMRFWNELNEWMEVRALDPKPLLIAGDLNITRSDLDVHPGQVDPTVIGQRPEERVLFQRFLDLGLIDSTRALHPGDDRLYTWWPYWNMARERNLGWRIDYVLTNVAGGLRPVESAVLSQFGSSDHAPVVSWFEGPGA